ncbi:MAG TPA: YqgE/AlgH family protein [Woeseiaceae bacterium]|nr:YqgE/AlgH family protein [Woeseiaceae bacterium]
MKVTDSLANQLLIAMPGMDDPNFSSTVTLICQHNDDGALGIVINRPLNLNLGSLFLQMNLDGSNARASRDAVVLGGPVSADRGFVLHDTGQSYEHSLVVSSDIQLTLSRDIINAMATDKGPTLSLVALGYAGWEPGQLESEMLANSWLTVAATPKIVFETPFAERWTAAAGTLGVDISRLSPDAGHA